MADINHERVAQAHVEYMAGAEQRAKDEAARMIAAYPERQHDVERYMDKCIALMLDRLLCIGASNTTEDVHFFAKLLFTPDAVGHMMQQLEKAGFTVRPFHRSVRVESWILNVHSNESYISQPNSGGLWNIIVKNTWATSPANVKSE